VDVGSFFCFCRYIGLVGGCTGIYRAILQVYRAIFLINTPLSSFTNPVQEDVWLFGGYIGPVRGFVGLFC